jgi:hypothetical protein
MIDKPVLQKNKFAVVTVSFVITAILLMQAAATFRLLCPPERFAQLASWRVMCEPLGWPFMNYPMYHMPHYEGETINYYQTYFELEGGEELPIYPEDLELNWWLFHRGIVASMIVYDEDGILFYVEMYEEKNQSTVVAVRLENQPTKLLQRSVIQESPYTVQYVRLDSLREE